MLIIRTGSPNRCSWPLTHSPCIYTPEECERLDASCRGFAFPRQIQVLNLETSEMVIERVLALDTAESELEDLNG
ncbi:DUF494 family protein [Shigella flexneri]